MICSITFERGHFVVGDYLTGFEDEKLHHIESITLIYPNDADTPREAMVTLRAESEKAVDMTMCIPWKNVHTFEEVDAEDFAKFRAYLENGREISRNKVSPIPSLGDLLERGKRMAENSVEDSLDAEAPN